MFKLHFLTLLACAFMAQPLIAEPSVVVTLGSIGDRIRAQNPSLAAARMRIQEAVGRMNQSGRLSNPDLDTSFEHNSNFREGKLEIGFSQRFPVTNRLQLEKEVSLTELKASEAEVREVERQIIAKAREAVVKVLGTRQRRELLREQIGVSKEFSDFLTEIAAKGEGSALDAGQAKLEAAGLSMEIRQLDASETALVGELKPLLGMRTGETLSVSGSLPSPSLPTIAADPSRRPDFQVAKLNAQAAAQGVALEQARRYDDVEGGLFAAAERMEDAPEGYENEAIIGLRFKVALPFWNKNEGAIQEAEAKKLRTEKEAIALGRGIRLEAEAARAEMAEWTRLIGEIDNTLLPLADEQSKLAEDAYRKGQGEIQAVLRAREKRLQLSAARLDALREFHLARVRHGSALAQP
ncbi:MAG: TolC family protein [Akkermansiaceae bacterium]|jgi:cobalt-zinc-cadmium efflux system outer membrane protein|nr:TolC family protein [Akkermansiaceae bacterium]